jgi:redox-sensitive bicupin YhaK (pirin superfamily)
MSAGTGVTHSEYNLSHINDLRLLQIWILPPEKNLVPIYGSYKYQENEFNNKLLNIVSSKHGNSKIQINQDINIYASKLDAKNNLKFDMLNHRQVYFVQIEGTSDVNGIKLNDGDALEIINEVNITISALTKSHILFIEMKK